MRMQWRKHARYDPAAAPRAVVAGANVDPVGPAPCARLHHSRGADGRADRWLRFQPRADDRRARPDLYDEARRRGPVDRQGLCELDMLQPAGRPLRRAGLREIHEADGLTFEEADRQLAAALRRVARERPDVSPAQRILALAIAAGVDRWIEAGRSGTLISEAVTYGRHGGVGWGGDGPPVDPLDACFAAHDADYDRCKCG